MAEHALNGFDVRTGGLTIPGINNGSQFQINGRIVSRWQILELVDWIESNGIETIERPEPIPNVPLQQAGSGWIWDLYSDDRLAQFYAEVHGLAAVAYDQSLGSVFSNFKWSMGNGADGPFDVVADISFSDQGWGGARSPGVSGTKVPMGTASSLSVDVSSPLYVSSNARAIVSLSGMREDGDDWISNYFENQRSDGAARTTNPFARGSSQWRAVADHVNHTRPASLVAASWIFDDLKALKLADGTFPQLDR